LWEVAIYLFVGGGGEGFGGVRGFFVVFRGFCGFPHTHLGEAGFILLRNDYRNRVGTAETWCVVLFDGVCFWFYVVGHRIMGDVGGGAFSLPSWRWAILFFRWWSDLFRGLGEFFEV